jgi:hypothetical protein
LRVNAESAVVPRRFLWRQRLESRREPHFRVLQSNSISGMFFRMKRAFPENTCCPQCCVTWGLVFSGAGRLKS